MKDKKETQNIEDHGNDKDDDDVEEEEEEEGKMVESGLRCSSSGLSLLLAICGLVTYVSNSSVFSSSCKVNSTTLKNACNCLGQRLSAITSPIVN